MRRGVVARADSAARSELGTKEAPAAAAVHRIRKCRRVRTGGSWMGFVMVDHRLRSLTVKGQTAHFSHPPGLGWVASAETTEGALSAKAPYLG